MNGGNCIFCSFCVFIGIWLIFVDIFTQSNTKLSLKGFLEVLSLHLKWVCYLVSQIGVLWSLEQVWGRGGRNVGQFHGLATRHPCKLANSAHTFEIQTGSGWGPVVITGVGSRQQWMNFHPLPSPLSTVNPLIVIVCIYVKDAPKTDIWGLLQICNAFPAESSPGSIWCRFLSVYSEVEQTLAEVAVYFRVDTICTGEKTWH